MRAGILIMMWLGIFGSDDLNLMIDRKKLMQRLNKGSKLKEYPLLNLYILVAALVQFLGQLFGSSFLQMLRPAPYILMIIYTHSKNSARKHLVPSLLEFALLFFLLEALASFAEATPNPISNILKALGHLVYCVSLGFGDTIRLLLDLRILRKLSYLAIIGATGGILYTMSSWLPYQVTYCIYLSVLSIQLCVCLWRYEITLRSSFMFSLCGSGALLIGGWVGLWQSWLAASLVQLLTYCGHYFLMHGSLHQSNLQFEIARLQDDLRRTY